MPSYRNPSTGKWYCKFYYTDYQGKKKQKKKEGFALKREAEAFERDFLQNISFQPEAIFMPACPRCSIMQYAFMN